LENARGGSTLHAKRPKFMMDGKKGAGVGKEGPEVDREKDVIF